MSKEKLDPLDCTVRFEIESLGPIRDSIIQFEPFLLFSGESNTGKSYTAMAVYYLFYLLNDKKSAMELVRKLFDIDGINKALKAENKVTVTLHHQLETALEKVYNNNISRFMAYMLGYDEFSCRVRIKPTIPQGIEIKISQGTDKDGNDYHRFELQFPRGGWTTNSWIESVKTGIEENDLVFISSGIFQRLFFHKGFIRNFFLPPARGAFSGLTPSMLKKYSGIGMYNEYLEGIDSVRFSEFETYDENGAKEENQVTSLFERLINGKIKIERDRVTYSLTGMEEEIPLAAGSASVKELFPLYLILNRVSLEETAICIEEPEAHLHPDLQRSAALLLSYIVNNGGFVQATTHSDFFLNQVNNLIKLHFIKEKDPGHFQNVLKETGIGEEFVLDPAVLGAYYFKNDKDGVRAEKLVITEKGMPLESFKRSYEQSVKETRRLREALTENDG